MATVGDAVLILAQEGADVGPVLSAWNRSVEEPSVVVLQQSAGEPLSEFKRRLRLRLAGLEATGQSLTRGAFIARMGFGLPDVMAAVALLSSLVAAMVPMGLGSVHLYGQAGDFRAGVALEALAGAMRDQVRGTGVEVVTDDSSYSGVHEIVSVGARSPRSAHRA